MPVLIADRFDLREKVGEGTFAEVWRAIDTQANTEAPEVALKIFRPLAAGDPEYCWEPVFREVAAGVQMTPHAHVLRAWALTNVIYFDQQETPCLIMEHIEGDNLALWLADQEKPGPFSLDARITVLSGLLRGIAHAHNCSVVHHDISFGNVLIQRSESNNALLCDFGASQTQDVVPGPDAPLEDQNELQAINPPPYCRFSLLSSGARRDVYAFGTLCYLTLTGRHPLTDDWQSMRANHWQGEPDPHRRLARRSMLELSSWMKQSAPMVALSDLLLRCVSPDPEMRPQSGSDVLSEWEDITCKIACL